MMDHSTADNIVEQQSSSCSSQQQNFLDNNTLITQSTSSGPHYCKSVLLTSSDHNIIHSKHFNSSFPASNNNTKVDGVVEQKEAELTYLSTLIATLLLTTSLASIAGLDAKVHCQSRQTYEINQLFDDDAVIFSQLQRVQEEHACVVMWRYVMLPVTLVTLTFGTIALYLVRRQQKQEQSSKQSHYRRLFTILFLLGGILLVTWIYGIVVIMLRPRNLQQDGNPYQSLAAVDNTGHVGDNANLYYLAWISMGLALAIIYQVSIELVRQYRRQLQRPTQQRQTTTGQHEEEQVSRTEDVEAMLSSYTITQLHHYRKSKETWYNSLYRLRIRSGIWVSALLATSVVLASSLVLWRDVLAPTASKIVGSSVAVTGVCTILETSGSSVGVPPELCLRTAFSILSGGTAACLCIGAIAIHACTRHGAAQVIQDSSCHPVVLSVHSDHFSTKGGRNIPLQTECFLSAVLFLLLGFNAVLATGVQGPAATVGNLYYASWISFLLCLRICMGCFEEVCNLGRKESQEEIVTSSSYSEQPTKSVSSDTPSISPDLFDNERARGLRRYLVLGIFSIACSASALDASFNQSSDLSMDQWFVIIAPTVVAILCIIQFAMCLGSVSYILIASNLVGGSLSILMFVIWLIDLIISMHSERSWAVNAIGDIKIANLYYFSWASIVTAGINMSVFLIKMLKIKEKDYMTALWFAMVKVCFVILGASFHIWHNIQGSCTFKDIESGAIDFCSRTVFAIVVSLVGMTLGGAVTLTRVGIKCCCPAFFSPHIRSHVEMILSAFMVLLFGVALALITGIGGPGQSVGDLFYASWLAFLVSLGIAMTCYGEIQRHELAWEQEMTRIRQKEADRNESDTPYVDMRDRDIV